MKLSVIIPVYNEHRTIEIVLQKVRDVAVDKEIIVVDGNSIDGTREILERYRNDADMLILSQSGPLGRGHALKEGLARATGDVVIFQDADLELDPSDYPALLAPIESGKADVVFGSRFLRGASANDLSAILGQPRHQHRSESALWHPVDRRGNLLSGLPARGDSELQPGKQRLCIHGRADGQTDQGEAQDSGSAHHLHSSRPEAKARRYTGPTVSFRSGLC